MPLIVQYAQYREGQVLRISISPHDFNVSYHRSDLWTFSEHYKRMVMTFVQVRIAHLKIEVIMPNMISLVNVIGMVKEYAQ